MGVERDLREIVEEWFHFEPPSRIVPREVSYSLGEEVQVVTGPRRAGKTYFMYQVIRELLAEGYSKRSIVYIDFEDPRLAGFRAEDLGVFLKVLREYFEWKPVLFLDEVQAVGGWSRMVRALHSKGFKVFVTGSSSKLLPGEIATELRGRCRTTLITTFSFREYLRAKNVAVETATYLDESRVKGHLREYLETGGYPRIVLTGDKGLAREYLETIFYRDIVERHRVRDLASLRLFQRMLLSSLGRLFSINKVYNAFKSLGVRKTKKTIINYLQYFSEAFFIVSVEKVGRALEPVKQPVKIYPIDLIYMDFSPHRGSFSSRLEAAVAIELYRRHRGNIYYWKDPRGREVDFVVTDNYTQGQLIQVTNELRRDDREQYRREIQSLIKASKELSIRELLVITWDQEETLVEDGLKIQVLPLWKWLIASPHTMTSRET